ncbi:hypothetical protein F7725_001316 [Dissostichus mawsoni]|uniref:Uncharacterized protein n=1 Tax=Dissostichus mawsoni TaxID=36200 RepID=A0A7J5ZJ00_DISMA|nr:hypothetical protein F7725_001316 [Dissostichus mawsoni]
MLTSRECEDLLRTLSHPEENIFQHLERLAPENNQLDLKPRAKRRLFISGLKSGTFLHTASLWHVLQTSVLHSVAFGGKEVGKNINQDKALSLKRYVEDYHKYKGPLDSALPLLYGLLLGFGGTFLLGVTILLIILHISRKTTRTTSSKIRVGHLSLKDAATRRSDAAK